MGTGYMGDWPTNTDLDVCGGRSTGVGGDQWYRFVGDGGVALPIQSPGCLHCGTDRVGWLSGWDAQHTPPPVDYAVPGEYPQRGDGVVNATVCFDYCDTCCMGRCFHHKTVGIVNCGDFIIIVAVTVGT